MASQQWSLMPERRAITVERITASITNLAFARGVVLSLEDARKAAATAEKTAHTTAQVESRTTTGSRPEAESLQAYTRSTRRQRMCVLKLQIASCTALVRSGRGDLTRISIHGSHHAGSWPRWSWRRQTRHAALLAMMRRLAKMALHR